MEYLYPIITGFLIGIVGSFHCIGMCGPLALAMPIHHMTTPQKQLSVFNYSIGRMGGYMIIGLIFGIVGMSFSLLKLQQVLSITAGIAMVAFVIFHYYYKRSVTFDTPLTDKIKSFLSKQLNSKPAPNAFVWIGLANGFLPCGLVYTGIIPAVATGSILKSTLLMMGFGMGTIPTMSVMMYAGRYLSPSIRKQLKFWTPVLFILIGMLLIIRGLNLGIPYLSPSISDSKITCCGNG